MRACCVHAYGYEYINSGMTEIVQSIIEYQYNQIVSLQNCNNGDEDGVSGLTRGCWRVSPGE